MNVYNAERNNHLKLYHNSIDIEISPENDIFFNFDMETIPDVVNISYCDVTDIIDLFNTPDGSILIQKVFSNEIVLNIFAVDTTYITEYEKQYLIGHESLLKRPNVNFYQIWYDEDVKFKYHLGSTIHEALLPFVKKYRDYSFDYSKKNKHFLTLNNVHTPDRESLFNIFNNLSEEDKEKFICSFKFANVHLDFEKENFNYIFNDFNIVFGHNIFPLYEKSLIEIVSESSKEAVTEKCFKPLLSGIPFIHWVSNSWTEKMHQIEIFKDMGIDTCYFGIDYTNKGSIEQKIKEILSLSIEEVIEKYQDDFKKAEENKKKVFEYIDTITNDIIKK